jgi:hypothetical protein
MKSFYSFIVILILSALLLANSANAQALTGTKTIPGDYATITLAITDLNSKGVGTGGVIFNVAAGYTETITSPLSITAAGTSANQITFQKSGLGTNPKITAYTTGIGTPGTAVQDGIWNLVGSDYITIDGIDLFDPNTTNPSTMEYGYGMFKASATNGCQYNTIKNCVVALNRDNNATATAPAVDGSRAINVVNSFVTTQTSSIAITSAAGTNSYNKFYSNTLQNCNIGIALIGSTGATPFTTCDFGNDIGGSSLATGNNIINFGGGTTATNPAAGIRTSAQYNLNVSYNTVNNNNGSGINHISTLRGIYLNTAVSASATISYNTLSISSGATTSQVSVIENLSGGTSAGNTININNNTINNCNWSTATTGVFYGIYNTSSATAANVNINSNTFASITHTGTGLEYLIYNTGVAGTALSISNNTFTNLSLAGSNTVFIIQNNNTTNNITISNNAISGTFAKTGGGTFYGINCIGAPTGGTATITANNFSYVTLTGAAQFYGISYNPSTTSQILVCTNNTISNNTGGSERMLGIYQGGGADGSTINGNTVSGLTNSSFDIQGISVGNTTAPVSLTVYNNTITGLSANSGYSDYGINNVLGSSNSIFKNRIYNLQANSGIVNGIYVAGGSTTNIYNNLISDLKSPNSNQALAITGIYLNAGTTNNVFYNTVYLNGSTTGANFSSAGIYATATSTTIDIRNNIIVNTSTPKGGGYTAAYRRSDATLTNYALTSNNNLFYAGTPGAKKVIFYNGTTAYQTLADYRTLVGPARDAASITELPPFMNIAATPYNLHINTAVPTQCESGGIRVTSPYAITTDYDGHIRWGEAGYTGTGIAPDIGADEFDSTYITGNINIACETPSEYNLYQNYPNPFNPSTKIKFDIIKNGAVRLTVYDIAGRIIVTLVNDELKSGKYEYTMTSVNIPSGVYFYRLETECYTMTRRMILIK